MSLGVGTAWLLILFLIETFNNYNFVSASAHQVPEDGKDNVQELNQ